MSARAGLAVAVGLLLASPAARAGDGSQPWAIGVTAAQKADAQKLLDAGNALFLDKKYADALDQYKRAVAIWDHPAIRFNIVRCDIQLDRLVEASDNLQLALQYGAAPLEEAVYSEALAYQKLLANQIGSLAVRCAQAGATLTLDGQPFGACPATEPRRVAPGRHQLLGVKTGFVPQTIEVVVVGGKQADVALALVPLADAGKVVHRWAAWGPWVVLGSGAAVAAMGGVLDLVAISDAHAYDDQVAIDCKTGCIAGRDDTALAALAKQRAAADHLGDAAIAVLATGIAGAATGAALLYLNRGRTVYPDTVTPVVTPMPGGAAVSIAGSF